MKLIIDNRTSLTDAQALQRVGQVVSKGKISEGRFGRQYSCGSVFNDGIVVRVERNAKSERFVIMPDPNPFTAAIANI